MKRVLVTAINTRLDQQLIEYLVSQEYKVRIIAKAIDAGNPLLKLPVEIYPGNAADIETVTKAARACDYIIDNCCPTNRGKMVNPADIIPHSRLVGAAESAGVKMLLHINVDTLRLRSQGFNPNTIGDGFSCVRTSSLKGFECITSSFLNIIFVQITLANNRGYPGKEIQDYSKIPEALDRILLSGKNGEFYLIDTHQGENNYPARQFTNSENLLHSIWNVQGIISKSFFRMVDNWAKIFTIAALITS